MTGREAAARREPLRRCAAGELPANVALMQLCFAAARPSDIDDALAEAIAGASGRETGRLEHALALWRASPSAFQTIKRIIAEADHGAAFGDSPAAVRHWAEVFDRLAALSPAAGSALYSLGRDDLLERVAAQIAARLRGWALLRPDSAVLDLGCGSGRMARALAGDVRLVCGLDVSERMLGAARRSCAGLAHAAFLRGGGHGLDMFADAAFDLVLAVDVFPYLQTAAGALCRRHLRDCGRVLAPGGSLAIFNYDYGRDPAAVSAELAALAAEAGFALRRVGARDIADWDGLTFLLRRAGSPPGHAPASAARSRRWRRRARPPGP